MAFVLSKICRQTVDAHGQSTDEMMEGGCKIGIASVLRGNLRDAIPPITVNRSRTSAFTSRHIPARTLTTCIVMTTLPCFLTGAQSTTLEKNNPLRMPRRMRLRAHRKQSQRLGSRPRERESPSLAGNWFDLAEATSPHCLEL